MHRFVWDLHGEAAENRSTKNFPSRRIRARYAVAFHWGLWALTRETYNGQG